MVTNLQCRLRQGSLENSPAASLQIIYQTHFHWCNHGFLVTSSSWSAIARLKRCDGDHDQHWLNMHEHHLLYKLWWSTGESVRGTATRAGFPRVTGSCLRISFVCFNFSCGFSRDRSVCIQARTCMCQAVVPNHVEEHAYACFGATEIPTIGILW